MTGVFSGRILEPETGSDGQDGASAPCPEQPLGAARGQVHENYIIAQTDAGIVIVDQHAAHERLVYEKLKRQMAENGVAAQALLIPEVVDLSPEDAARLLDVAEDLHRMGLAIEPFGGGAVAVRETPAILGEVNAENLLRDILDELSDLGHLGAGSGQDRGDPVARRLPRIHPLRPGDARRGNERAAARDGGNAPFRPVQPRATHLCRAQAVRHRAAVRSHMIRIGDTSYALNDPVVLLVAGRGGARPADPVAVGRLGARGAPLGPSGRTARAAYGAARHPRAGPGRWPGAARGRAASRFARRRRRARRRCCTSWSSGSPRCRRR